MNGRTHLLLGVASGVAFNQLYGIPEYTPWLALAGALGGLLPDIDHPQAIISGFVPFGGVLRLALGGHRGFTHTLLFWGLVFGASFALFPAPNNRLIVLAMALGVMSHLIADMLTPRGVHLLAPVSNFNFTLLPSGLLSFTSWIIEAVATVGALAVILLSIRGRLPI